MKKVALIDTIPKDARNQGSINLGLEIVKDIYDADVYHWTDRLGKKYDTIAFNVFYAMHLLNVVPFLKNNMIEPLKDERNRDFRLIAGGQGIGRNHILSKIVDEEFYGELDFEENKKEIISKERVKLKKGVIELTRGCKYSCKFCEYAWVTGGMYREKPIQLVKEQIDRLTKLRIFDINFMSANFGGYSDIDELMDYAKHSGVRILNTDINIMDIKKILPYTKQLQRTLKIGVESFDEKARRSVGKGVSDEKLMEIITELVKHFNYLHFYLIYGIPNDNYDKWIEWLHRLSVLRKEYTLDQFNLFNGIDKVNTKNLRFEFSITNFEPCSGTPMGNCGIIDFNKKHAFLDEWARALLGYGFRKGDKIEYKTSRGRFGRKELSYKMLMHLKTGASELTQALIYSLPQGVGRSVLDKDANKFLEYV